MKQKLLVLPAIVATFTACNTEIALTDVAVCDGILQSTETTVDDVFDRDDDGYFDAQNAGCQATYPTTALDCDDANPDANPITSEVLCNNIDDDCDPSTSDLDDRGCTESYDGTWELDSTITYSCAFGNVNVDFDRLVITHDDPQIIMTAVGGGVQPGSLDGTLTVDSFATVQNILAGACTETYEITGSFVNPNTFEGEFRAEFSGGFMCGDCSVQSWDFSATR